SATNTPANITGNINFILLLNGTNFKSWQENLLVVLRVMDLDLALRVDSPTPLTDKSTFNEKRDIKRWEKSNRMCMMIMKKVILKSFRGTIFEKITTAKKFLADIEKRFVKNEKAKIGTLLTSLISMRYKTKGNIRFSQFRVSYNCQKETWSLNELISNCVQEEERLKQDKS
ncbi:uncharacterized protein LOC112092787, partial [Morus notabilis]|uniref:uncharacterized protein LOC112092787 n=1 Tax=Morus notabilis TaxID=981085 RepID=UPI000CED2D83